MSLRKALYAVGVVAMIVAGAVHAQPLGIGKPAPDFTVTDVNGKTVSLKDLRGKIVVMDWVNPECDYDDGKHYLSGNIPTMQRDFHKEGVVWLSFNSAAPGKQGEYSGAKLDAWLKKVKWNGDHYTRDLDGHVGHMYHATATPDFYIIDKDGNLVYAGAIDNIPSTDVADIPHATNYVRKALAEVMAGKPVTTPVTRPYGCTVKYGDES